MVLEDMTTQFKNSGQNEKAEQISHKAEEVKKRSALLREYIFKQDSNGLEQMIGIKNDLDMNT